MAIRSDGVCSIFSALGQEAVQVPHWIHSLMLSPPGIVQISSINVAVFVSGIKLPPEELSGKKYGLSHYLLNYLL
jgi:hypothetical protein